ncbi:TolB-like translocation protein [Undibacterium umbellatum]|uniref:PD40 domain-containing protein n=1 Tax=Undibacterium umbellatum TaxID=2762300 RepID=A0ABR6ZFF5_9BURK|nr:PD40 domain-containing protein [Undibacterium umbellatum]MBC3910461.1 PD40 domain-containing protein [Undibacterium umbellatum]
MKPVLKALLFACSMLASTAQAQADPALFQPGLISDGGVFGLALSPDGNQAFWVQSQGRRIALRIMSSSRVNGVWQTPQIASFSRDTQWKDIDPAISPDGKTLIFQSNRPVPGKPERKGFDIWASSKTADGWGAAYHLGNVINTDASESSASIAANGNIYFMKENEEAAQQSDLYVSRFINGAYQTPENLGPPINSKERESNPYVAPDESYLIYFSTRPGGYGDVDLYISFREQGKWTEAVNLGQTINSAAAEFCPLVHQGRIYLSRQVKQGDRFIENIYSFPFDAEQYRSRR